MINEVIIVFKTHLDIGYTDYASVVTEKYLNEFIPNALRIAEELRDTDTPFIWSCGSWLIYEGLKRDTDGRLEAAIRDGLIKWHALPFTSHTELMNEELFSYALSLSKKLDERFGFKTVGAKMTDVPGHTKAMVPLLADAGVELLHIGVNPATPIPNVPDVFKWRAFGKEITVMYNKGYGNVIELGDKAFYFSITNDNLGPSGTDNVKALYDSLREKYPTANVHAGTLDDVAIAVRGADLPVVEDEIGDSWIHGVATDPTKLRAYKAALRAASGRLADFELTDNLLLVPEHTWGMCVQVHLPNDEFYHVRDFDKIPGKEHIERSWQEQREYVDKATELMGLDISEDMKVELPDLSGAQRISAEPSFEVIYQLFDIEDMRRFEKDYLQITRLWAYSDMLKPGIPLDYKGGSYKAHTVAAYELDGKRIFKLEFDADIKEFCGLPSFFVIEDGDGVEVRWFGKKNNRLPEAIWAHPVGYGQDFIPIKMGKATNPKSSRHSRNLHAAEAVVNNDYRIDLIDSAVVAPYGMHLWDFGTTEDSNLYFNLYNNKWNTNFPLWFSDDSRFRFKITRI